MQFQPSKLSWTKEQLQKALLTATSLADIEKQLGMSGNNQHTIRKYAELWGIDLSVIKHNKKERVLKLTNEEIFKIDTLASSSTAKNRILKDNLIEYKCYKCNKIVIKDGIAYWEDLPISLQLDHINGEVSDNRLENLRFLCPNCHTQTNTFGSRNAFKNLSDLRSATIINNNALTTKVKSISLCEYCGKTFEKSSNNQFYCSIDCSNKSPKNKLYKGKDKISKDELMKLVWEKPATEIAAQLGVSSKSIKKWCVQYGIETPSRGYWAKKYADKLESSDSME